MTIWVTNNESQRAPFEHPQQQAKHFNRAKHAYLSADPSISEFCGHGNNSTQGELQKRIWIYKVCRHNSKPITWLQWTKHLAKPEDFKLTQGIQHPQRDPATTRRFQHQLLLAFYIHKIQRDKQFGRPGNNWTTGTPIHKNKSRRALWNPLRRNRTCQEHFKSVQNTEDASSRVHSGWRRIVSKMLRNDTCWQRRQWIRAEIIAMIVQYLSWAEWSAKKNVTWNVGSSWFWCLLDPSLPSWKPFKNQNKSAKISGSRRITKCDLTIWMCELIHRLKWLSATRCMKSEIYN